MQQAGALIPVERRGDETYFTTPTLLQYEHAVLQALSQLTNGKPISPENIAAYLAQHPTLTPEQQHAIRTLFFSPYRINLLEDPTGSGKTTLLKPMMELAKRAGSPPRPSAAPGMDLHR